MADTTTYLTLEIDVQDGQLVLALLNEHNVAVDELRLDSKGHADEIILIGVDKMLKRNNIDRSALTAIQRGQGIDKNSSLDRIVTSFASAIVAASYGQR
jgi:hypothetical protein